ncbi:MAG: HAD-IA family hydrolase [Candidatus Altiarchaeales archaeon]|nr:HAD-IA family hydrolase [Candidatus Altiarchaeales archaeon]MBD3416158.1 HAD-IA family hydrolase [Candidatus Altiarchaeales archaeon]
MDYVIFDLDGTLVDLFELHLRGFQELVSEEYGLEFAREDLESHYGRTAEEIARTFFEEKGVEDVDYDDFVVKRRRKVVENLSTCELLPGAVEILDSLKNAGFKLALATANTPDTGKAILDACRVREYFNAEVYRSEGLKSKPEPDIFLKAAEELDAKPSDCVVLEDSVFGVQAAKSAGMKVIAVTTGTHTKEELERQKPDLIVESLEEVKVETVKGVQ